MRYRIFIRSVDIHARIPGIPFSLGLLQGVGGVFIHSHSTLHAIVLTFVTSFTFVSFSTGLFSEFLSYFMVMMVVLQFQRRGSVFVALCKAIFCTLERAIYLTPGSI